MTTHLRRLSNSDLDTLPARGLASFGGVRVGTSGGDAIAHVAGSNRADLPGKHVADDWGDLHNAVKPNVLEARWEEEDPETGETTERRGKMSDVPDGAKMLENEIAPHAFA